MTKRDTPPDLDKYLPDEAALAASMTEPVDYDENVDPKLVERLRELNRLSSPSVPRIAPPSITEYVPPTKLPASAGDAKSREPKVEVVLPPSRNDSPTLPSLRRLEGEPELPGVVNRASPATRVSRRGAVLAGLAALVAVALVLALGGRSPRHPERGGAASAGTAIEPPPSAPPAVSESPTATPSNSAAVAPAASVVPSAEPAASTAPSVAPHAPTAAAASRKPKPKGALDDPYDAAAPPSTAATVVPTAAPSVAPTVPPSAPSSAPSTTKPGPAGGNRVIWK